MAKAFQPVLGFGEGDKEGGGKPTNTQGSELQAQRLSVDKQEAFPARESLAKAQSQFIDCRVVWSEEEGSRGRPQALEQNSSPCHSGS